MESILIVPNSNDELEVLKASAQKNNQKFLILDEETRKMIARVELSKLAEKNPKAYATDEEIISVVEEVRKERYGK